MPSFKVANPTVITVYGAYNPLLKMKNSNGTPCQCVTYAWATDMEPAFELILGIPWYEDEDKLFLLAKRY